MTGATGSLEGGVSGRAADTTVSIFWSLDSRRYRSVDLILDVSDDSTAWLWFASWAENASTTIVGLWMAGEGAAEVVGTCESELLLLRSAWSGSGCWRSGLELAVVVELFRDLKTSRKRPPGDGDLRSLDEGGARPFLEESEAVAARASRSAALTGRVAVRVSLW